MTAMYYVVLPMCAATSEAHDVDMDFTYQLHHRMVHDRTAALETAACRNRLVRDVRAGRRSMLRRRSPSTAGIQGAATAAA